MAMNDTSLDVVVKSVMRSFRRLSLVLIDSPVSIQNMVETTGRSLYEIPSPRRLLANVELSGLTPPSEVSTDVTTMSLHGDRAAVNGVNVQPAWPRAKPEVSP